MTTVKGKTTNDATNGEATVNGKAEPSVERLGWGQTWPDREEFHALADAGYRVIPIVRRLLADSLTPVGFYERLAGGRSGTFILESAEYGGNWSRYSFIGVNSIAQLRSNGGEADWLGEVPAGVPEHGDVIEVAHEALKVLKAPRVKGLPSLTSGLVGSVGWDAIRHWEPTLRAQAPDETGQPELALALATDIAVVDHVDGSVWLIANAVNVDDKPTRADAAYDEAVARVEDMQRRASTPVAGEARVSVLDPHAPTPELRFRTPKETYEHAVEETKRHIVDGDVFQTVISQRLDLDSPADPFDVYRVLRTLNPSPYMYFMTLTDAQGRDFNVIGSSPETLIKVDEGHAMTFPIAGSRPRGATPEEDARLARELLEDPKERSEHIMLVDLSRNDLSKVCVPSSVEVVQLMDIKRFSHIMHICSTVTGTVDPSLTAFDVFKSTFPAGTLSGAPKPRAIEIIDELEPADRGIYGGTVGYFDFSGNMDMAIAIRTAFLRDHEASVQAGAGLVLDSVPANEWQETRNKAEASVEAVQIAARLRTV
ncbi:anthranilate synthase component I [Bifidobacterium simiarum]|uniref:anthranilate synthase component I n=1 Tax=Bifidobacterium simiarum TaxID=2045441 RepID=UPI001BDD1A1B|nr:anthranilate synthase component I [Bifidobacterium simiarum]MBT1166814.1 anthranilate synthase component I [Bifidobacterium simiarum]